MYISIKKRGIHMTPSQIIESFRELSLLNKIIVALVDDILLFLSFLPYIFIIGIIVTVIILRLNKKRK